MRGMLPSRGSTVLPLTPPSDEGQLPVTSEGGDLVGDRATDVLRELEGLRREVGELRASRMRLALAADAERRGLERALHDGVQQELVGLAANLDLAAASVEADPAAAKSAPRRDAARCAAGAGGDAELADRIYPPLLEAGGLSAALRSRRRAPSVPIRIDVAMREGVSAGDRRRRLLLLPRRVRARAARTPVAVTVAGRGGSARLRDRRGRATWSRNAPLARSRRGARRPADDPARSPTTRPSVVGSLPLSRMTLVALREVEDHGLDALVDRRPPR